MSSWRGLLPSPSTALLPVGFWSPLEGIQLPWAGVKPGISKRVISTRACARWRRCEKQEDAGVPFHSSEQANTCSFLSAVFKHVTDV